MFPPPESWRAFHQNRSDSFKPLGPLPTAVPSSGSFSRIFATSSLRADQTKKIVAELNLSNYSLNAIAYLRQRGGELAK